jgi:hypothetical protein
MSAFINKYIVEDFSDNKKKTSPWHRAIPA